MDPNMENYFRMQQSGGYKIPFYMAYPMQDVYLSEIEYERDRERLKEMYPKEAKRIQRVVEEECDKMEYDGSLMFDEYPDRVMVQKLCDDIYNKVYDNTTAEVETEQYRDRRPGGGFPPPPPPPPRRDRGGRDLIEILLFDEMFRRRCRHNGAADFGNCPKKDLWF